MSVSKSNGSTIKKHTRLMARARIGRKSTSAVSAALKLASTITLRARISSATRKRVHGEKITAASRMAIRWSRVAALAMKRGKSVDFTGYWQTHIES
jgi:hypothetical protein